ncbi:hypothetical protein [Streptomyces sp. Wh19]|uniref:hypothetical protein n=1 Tax=Streptomyces sp. Wh19 TaxID=3076629 RepID=UPI0029588EDA|nr:hypothetical protein [Streptomyces sp. Wh19]MDV9194661.1 hypothetical protein [Streptomyces sp. Wh19]
MLIAVLAPIAHSSSLRLGEKNRCSSCAVISRLNRRLPGRGGLHRVVIPHHQPGNHNWSLRTVTAASFANKRADLPTAMRRHSPQIAARGPHFAELYAQASAHKFGVRFRV